MNLLATMPEVAWDASDVVYISIDENSFPYDKNVPARNALSNVGINASYMKVGDNSVLIISRSQAGYGAGLENIQASMATHQQGAA